ncbi:MAG: hypothetical protein MJ016_02555 [Victivallaceae bacterium]|nr:hypothetical protein [Victivallaceae bacterium]
MRRTARPIVRRYVHTGGFNQLAGKSLAPGSVTPESLYWKWRMIYAFFAIGILGAGVVSLCFF